MSTLPADRKKVTTTTFLQKKKKGQPISMLTAYDYPSALAADAARFDSILVGDSLGMVVLGYENTLPVTMQDMLHHCKAVARGASKALLIGDMPFMSYQASIDEAVRNAGRFLQEASMDAVKLEGGQERAEAIRRIVQAGIPVCGHIGLTPQSVQVFGGFKMQGKTALTAQKLLQDALALQEAGCFTLVLESIPEQLAAAITQRLEIPTIGIGAGANCDGQVLVYHDVLGLFDRFVPRFARQYANLNQQIHTALTQFREEIDSRAFPTPENSTAMQPEEWQAFSEWLTNARLD
ncbi:3-methyl-2-oxobutanoate hydroxymethyltransferase [Ornatilinea apprima]|uniref:3-methyl-2-oxobutanoate hydroxymethyltransferase n=1 Tax=Ornatilinea apprima TaxID=1134406 RepID=A0A0P6Y216_9CHLR|nr:3-methyl-2-oxobutanoate hydroxymethyltransferase [Ornatilinea apprima]KPL79005.1 3-methyl-2-oxobutanoate hydroxymethyltransferase [Ornatilinea apprima]